MNINFNDFATGVTQWCEQRSPFFRDLWVLHGGWEAWIQADLAAFLLKKNTTYDILREQSVYQNNRQKVDWLFNDSGMEIQKILIELKAQSFRNAQNFIPGMQSDIDKLRENNVKFEYLNSQKGAMGIYFDNDARNWMLENNFVEVFNNNDVGCGIRRLN